MKSRTTTNACAALAACAIALALTASSAFASSHEERSLQDTVRDSDLILVGEVTAIDEAAGLETGEALTSVTVQVERVLRGQAAKRGDSFEIIHRGGMRDDGLQESFSSRPVLTVGDRYVVCLVADFPVMPFIGGGNGLLRVANVDGKEIVVDEAGRALIASATLGLMPGPRVADSFHERLEKRQANALNRAEVSREKMAQTTDAAEVFAMLEQIARSAPPAKRTHTKRMPQPFPIGKVY
jgi:hypothetical protein